MENLNIPPEVSPVLVTMTGSERYAYSGENSDRDLMVLSKSVDRYTTDPPHRTDYFFVSLETFRRFWAHPLRLADLTSDCTGDERLCAFLREHRAEIPYAAPSLTVRLGLEYIAQGERSKYDAPIKAALRTAMVLSHMAAGAEDPFLLSEEEKAVLIRARGGGVPVEERADIYRRTISPENIGRLMNLPDHPTIKNELFQLLEEVTSC